MNVIDYIFLNILGMSLTASYCVLAVCLLRILLRKMPKIFSYCLWGVVALRLVCPVLPESRFSLMGDAVMESARRISGAQAQTPDVSGKGNAVNGFFNEITEKTPLPTIEEEAAEKGGDIDHIAQEAAAEDFILPQFSENEGIRAGEIEADSVNAAKSAITNTDVSHVIHFASAIWLGIFLILCAYGIGSYLCLKIRLAKVAYAGRDFEKIPVKYAPGIETSFVLGLVRPVVYLPDTLTNGETLQCLSHERVHIRRRDYLIKQFAFALVCVHWFNPIVWLAFHLMSQDMEMSCDEQALQSTSLADRKAYSNTLLKVSTDKPSFGGCPLAFGENSASLRIKNIMNYKKPGFWVTIAACVVIGAGMIGLFTNPMDKTMDQTKQDTESRADPQNPQISAAAGEEDQNNTLTNNMEEDSRLENVLPEQPRRSIGPVQAQYEAQLADILQKNLENNYLKNIGILEASIKALEDSLNEQNLKLTKLRNDLNDHLNDVELEVEIAEITKIQEGLALSVKEAAAEKEALEMRLQEMDITDMDGQSVTLDYGANQYLNQPGINCFLMQNFNTSQIDLDFLLYDGADLENSEPSAEELQLLEELLDAEIFYHFTGEQVDSFLTEKLGLPLSEIRYGTDDGNTLKDKWEYIEEYDSYTMSAPKGDTFYTKVDCWNVFRYYNGILRLDYKNADKKASNLSSAYPLVEGSLYLAPKDARNGDINHLDSYYIIGNAIHKGTLKDRDPDLAFDLSEYLNRLKQL